MKAHRFTFHIDGQTPAHQTMRVFGNGASAGLLTMRTDDGEAQEFQRRVVNGPQLVEALRNACDVYVSLASHEGWHADGVWPQWYIDARTALTAAGVTHEAEADQAALRG